MFGGSFHLSLHNTEMAEASFWPFAGVWRGLPALRAERRQTIFLLPRSSRVKGPGIFHGRFYVLRNSCCKTAQFCATPCECSMADHLAEATLRNPLKTCA